MDQKTYLLRLGQDLKAARRRRKWTLKKVHEAIQCSQQTVQRMEKGDAGVGIGRYLAYISLLGLALADLDDSRMARVVALQTGSDTMMGNF